jgi:hypothetical protein
MGISDQSTKQIGHKKHKKHKNDPDPLHFFLRFVAIAPGSGGFGIIPPKPS